MLHWRATIHTYFYDSLGRACSRSFRMVKLMCSLQQTLPLVASTHVGYGSYFCYRPQRSCGKVMFLHLSVILFMEGCLVDTPLGRHPPTMQTPPSADTPHPQDTPLWADTPSGQTPLLDRHRHPPPETATAADGKHPTGMHSCSCVQNLFLHFPTCQSKIRFVHKSMIRK